MVPESGDLTYTIHITHTRTQTKTHTHTDIHTQTDYTHTHTYTQTHTQQNDWKRPGAKVSWIEYILVFFCGIICKNINCISWTLTLLYEIWHLGELFKGS